MQPSSVDPVEFVVATVELEVVAFAAAVGVVVVVVEARSGLDNLLVQPVVERADDVRRSVQITSDTVSFLLLGLGNDTHKQSDSLPSGSNRFEFPR